MRRKRCELEDRTVGSALLNYQLYSHEECFEVWCSAHRKQEKLILLRFVVKNAIQNYDHVGKDQDLRELLALYHTLKDHSLVEPDSLRGLVAMNARHKSRCNSTSPFALSREPITLHVLYNSYMGQPIWTQDR